MANRQVQVVPTGIYPDGSPYFQESDIIVNKRVSVNALPPNSAFHLLVFPSGVDGQVFTGDPTPFTCHLVDMERYYVCRHVTQKADKKNGIKVDVLCNAKFEASMATNIGTFRTHCRSIHWRRKVFHTQVLGQKGLTGFFGAKRPRLSESNVAPKNKSNEQSTAAVASSGDVTSSGGGEVASTTETTNNKSSQGSLILELETEQLEGPVQRLTNYHACKGIHHSTLFNFFPADYDFVRDYPFSMHSIQTQTSFESTNFIPNMKWSVDTNGVFRSQLCSGFVVSSESDTNTTLNCSSCASLPYNQNLRKVLASSVRRDYGQLPTSLLPMSIVDARIAAMKKEIYTHRLQKFNYEKRVSRLSMRVDDHSRILIKMQDEDIPALRRLMAVHFRNKGSVKSFLDKLVRASESKLVGHGIYQRGFIQRGKFTNGVFDKEAFTVLLLTILTSKLGCNKLVHTSSYVHGTMSHRQMQRHVNQFRTVPNFNLWLTNAVDEQGIKSIDRNLDNTFGNQDFLKFLPEEGNWLAVLLIDGVAIDESLNIDTTQLPHQITGGCRHCLSCTFDTMEDAMVFEEKLNNKTYHLAKEAEVFAIGLIHPTFTSLIPICISPTCKADEIIGESTNTVFEILSAITKRWHTYPISKRLIMSTYASDGASQFRKAVGQVLNKDLPPEVRRVYVRDNGSRRCLLLNLVGGETGTTASCDNDHLGKRVRAAMKRAAGVTIASVQFTKAELTVILRMTGHITSADEAHKLFSPDDLMDVRETVRCLATVGKLADVTMNDFPAEWRANIQNRQRLREMKLLGMVMKLMCTSIIGHSGDIEEEGDHLSVSGYLTSLAKLSHMLFVLFRRNKTNFIPAQNYRNWQEMIKNMFIAVTLAKVNGVTDFWWFLNTSKRIEELFGIVRSMRRGDMNFDALGLRDRVADGGMVNWIYEQKPEWKPASRRLQSTIDRKNTISWKGDTKLVNVNEVDCWLEGKNLALAALNDSRVFSDDELNIDLIVREEKGVDMFRPYCKNKRVGVLSGDRAEYNLADLEEETDEVLVDLDDQRDDEEEEAE